MISTQVAKWSYREALSGLGVTMGRNTGLFSAFVVYMDLLRPYLGDSPFVYGATCSNLAWLTVWCGPGVLTLRAATACGGGEFEVHAIDATAWS